MRLKSYNASISSRTRVAIPNYSPEKYLVCKNIKDYNLCFHPLWSSYIFVTYKALCGLTGREMITFIILKESIAKKTNKQKKKNAKVKER